MMDDGYKVIDEWLGLREKGWKRSFPKSEEAVALAPIVMSKSIPHGDFWLATSGQAWTIGIGNGNKIHVTGYPMGGEAVFDFSDPGSRDAILKHISP